MWNIIAIENVKFTLIYFKMQFIPWDEKLSFQQPLL